ncbi:HipA family kinase [Hymenobacter edaphi]|uniref:HipA family kinase n=1 Tax=Hymenobacter edaphi TaxID=2211146 RepID=UPI0026CFE6EA
MLRPPEPLRVRTVHDVVETAHRPLLVMAENGSLYYLKYARHQLYELKCEWLCHYLLRLWGIPTPDIAVLTVPPEIFPTFPPAAQSTTRYLQQPAFGSKLIPGAIDSSDFIQQGTLSELATLSNPDDLLWIALFDAWVANDDRRASHHNLIIAPAPIAGRNSLQCWAIDHAFTFTSQPFQYLDHTETYFSFNTNVSQAAVARSVLNQWKEKRPLLWASELKEGYYLRIRHCRHQFAYVCSLLPAPFHLSEVEQTHLFYFLFCQRRLELLWDDFFASLPQS